MPGKAVVTIREKQWQVDIASTPWELAQGLGGLAELPERMGILFDTGWEQYVTVTTAPMLFDLDIAFLSESLEVVDTAQRIAPGQQVTPKVPCRHFLEVNAGELDGIDPGDMVSVDLLPLQEVPLAIMPDWAGAMFSFVGLIVMGAFMMGITRSMVKGLLGNPGSPEGRVKHYHGAYLTNWQYGGYSYTEEDPNKPERLWMRGMVDYAKPEDIIAIAKRENLPHVSLAGGFWEEVGYKGWGEKVSVGEAKKAVAKARRHVFNKERKPRAEYVWLRLGDVAEYEKFDSPGEAGQAVGERLAIHSEKQQTLSYRYRAAGVVIEPYFTGNNYISLYWGDEEAQWVTDLTSKEKRKFEYSVEAQSGFKRRGELLTRYDVSVSSFVERDRLGIWITDNRTDKTIAEWWDDDARQMFEDGFFKPATFTHSGELGGAAFIDSVLDYAEEMRLLAKENPGHPREAASGSSRIKARSITLRRAEGKVGTDDFTPRTLTGTKDESTWEEAEHLLFEWAQTAPRDGSYHKVDYTVTYGDDRTFKGRYDLKHWSEEYPSLASHMRSALSFYAGKYCPPHMTEEQYRNTLKSKELAEMKPEAERLLSQYEIGDITLSSQAR